MNPATLKRAVETDAHRRLAAHEAAHAAAALLLDLDVHGADAPYWRLEDVERGDPNDAAGIVMMSAPTAAPDLQRKTAVAILAGPLEDNDPTWPPTWPITAAAVDGSDTAELARTVATLGLDRAGYAQLVQDAYALTGTREYRALHAQLAHALERHGRLDARTIAVIKRITLEGAEVEHVLLKAATTAADAGTFTAVISTASVDRDGDIIDPAALVTALHKWLPTGKLIPLAWNHSTAAEDIIGHVDPATAHTDGSRVTVDGWIDQTVDPAGKNAWRLVKSGTLGFSYGFLVPDGGATKRPGRGSLITDLDVFEISATPTPANAETRVVDYKAVGAPDLDDLAHVRAEWAALIGGLMNAAPATKARRDEPLRHKAERIEREHAPIQIASFAC